jgi:hypothetical protein
LRLCSLACACCFRYLGSVELQIARRLLRCEAQPAGPPPAAEAGPEPAEPEEAAHSEDEEAEGAPVDVSALNLPALRNATSAVALTNFMEDAAGTMRAVKANPGMVIQLHNLARGNAHRRRPFER